MMTQEIAKVPVEFNGQLFRSELVAVWARFLDLIEQPWQQDNHGISFDGESFESDLFLPDIGPLGCYIRINPGPAPPPYFQTRAQRFLDEATHWSGFFGVITYGTPLQVFFPEDFPEDARGSAFAAGPHPYPHQWGELVTRGRRAATRMAAIAARQVQVEPLHL